MNKNLIIGGAVGAAAGFGVAKLFKGNKTVTMIATIAVAVAGAYVGKKM